MIRFAKKSDRPALAALWMEVFQDAPQVVEAFFAAHHREDTILMDLREGALAGMLTMLPLSLASPGQSFRARYIYAVATHPAFRNRGISTGLMDFAHSYMQSRQEDAAILVPASPGLFDFYGKRGYATAFSLDVLHMDAGALPPAPPGGRVFPCLPKPYARLRDKAFLQSRLYARWGEAAVAYAVQSFDTAGGVLHFTLGAGEGCAAWESREDGAVLIKDMPLLGISVPEALALVHQALQAPAYWVRLPAGTLPGGETLPFGMIRWLIPTPAPGPGSAPYLSLAMD